MPLGKPLRTFDNARVGGCTAVCGKVVCVKFDNVEASASDTEKAVIDITYSSVYGDRWRVRSDRIVPERL